MVNLWRLENEVNRIMVLIIIFFLLVSSLQVTETDDPGEKIDVNSTGLLFSEESDEELITFATNDWNAEYTLTPRPTKRGGHRQSTIWGTDKILMFGGDNSFISEFYNDTWVFDVSDKKWTEKKPKKSPSKRFSHAMTPIHGTDKIVLFGGSSGSSETWVYDLSDNNWSKQNPAKSPQGRSVHAMTSIYADDKVLMYGGTYGGNETWIYDLSDDNWTDMDPPTKPGAKKNHGLTALWRSYEILMFGGNNDNETWIYDYSKNNWTKQNIQTNPVARGDRDIAAIWGTDKILMYRGDNWAQGTGYETWIYDHSANTWTKQTTSNRPNSYADFALSSIWDSPEVVLFGGFDDGQSGWFSDATFVYTTTTGYSNMNMVLKAKDTGQVSYFDKISWNANTTASTKIKIQVRTAASYDELKSKTFIGPDGKTSSFYTESPSNISYDHYGDRWIQLKVYFTTTKSSETPKLINVSINFDTYLNYGKYWWVQDSYNDFNSGTKNKVLVNPKEYDNNNKDAEVILSNDFKFTQLSTPFGTPPKRMYHSMCSLWGLSFVTLYGGEYYHYQQPSNVRTNDTWSYDFVPVWNEIKPSSGPNHTKHGMSEIWSATEVMLFGEGRGGKETWIYNPMLGTWTKRSPHTQPDKAWVQMQLTWIWGTDKVLLYDGASKTSWFYDYSDNNWTKRTHSTAPSVSSNNYAMSSIYGTDKVVLYRTDTWIYDYSDNTWTKKASWSSPTKSDSFYFRMSYIYDSDKVVMHGGTKLSTRFYLESWIYDLSENSWKRTQRDGPSYSYHIENHAMASDTGNSQIVIFGGLGGGGESVQITKEISLEPSYSNGYLVSTPYDTTSNASFKTISWNRTATPNSSLKFQIRTATTQAGLSQESFVGPDGSTSTYYTDSPIKIWPGHESDRWIQYKAFLVTTYENETARLREVNITYNLLPKADLFSPSNLSIMVDNSPLFEWYLTEPDTNQTAFQILIDDNIQFSNIDFDSGEISSISTSWQFPNGTSYTILPDGIWYCKVRVQNSDHDWGPYSTHWKIVIDTTPPINFTPAAQPSGWTINSQPEISFSAIDPISGISHYEVSIDSGNFSNRTSPYTLPPQSEGIHNVTVRAYDNVSNYIDRYVMVYIDISPPLTFTPNPVNFNAGDWNKISDPTISFFAVDEISGVDHYEVSVDGGDSFSVQISPYLIPLHANSSDYYYDIVVRAFDKAGNFRDGPIDFSNDGLEPEDIYIGANEAEFPPTGIIRWISDSQPEISFHALDEGSGVDHYELNIGGAGFMSVTNPHIPPSPLQDGVHSLVLRAYDEVGNYREIEYELKIDTAHPEPYSISVDPAKVTNENRPTITFNTSDETSGVREYQVSLDSDEFSIQESPFRLPELDNGIHNITIRAYDLAGNFVEAYFNIQIDLDPPGQASIVINDDAEYTNSTRVSLELNAMDMESGLSDMSFSLDTSSWSAWEPFAASKYFDLTDDDGTKTVHLMVRDNAGNIAGMVSDSIILDTDPPINVSISINKDARYTNSLNVDLMIDAQDLISGVSDMSYSFDNVQWTDWEVYNNELETSLPPGDGDKVVYIKIRDLVGNIATVNDTIILDTIPPHSLLLVINNGQNITNSTTVSLKMSAVDDTSGIYRVAISGDGISWHDWEDLSETNVYTLSSGDGLKIIFFRVIDNAGNVAQSISSSIYLTTTVSMIDTDGDGFADEVDDDDDNDGFLDLWENTMDTDPKDPDDKPADTDSDLKPDGNKSNSEIWMDNDDDNDGIPDDLEIEQGTDPLMKDTDLDGYDDGVDDFPTDPGSWKNTPNAEASENSNSILLILVIIVVIIIVLFIVVNRNKGGIIQLFRSKENDNTPVKDSEEMTSRSRVYPSSKKTKQDDEHKNEFEQDDEFNVDWDRVKGFG